MAGTENHKYNIEEPIRECFYILPGHDRAVGF
jgi:hypothetical protein